MTSWEDLWRAPTAPAMPAGPLLSPGEASAYALAALARETDAVRSATEGTRNHTLNRAAYYLAQLVEARHLDERTVRDHLEAAARQAGLSEIEIKRTLRSGVKGGRASGPRQVEALSDGCKVIETTLDDILGVTTPLPPTEDPVEGHPLWDARPVLSHIRTFAYSRMCSPWSVLGVVLLRVLATVPPHVVLPPIIGGHGSLNLFCALVAPSGGGKGATESTAADAVTLPHEVIMAPVGSGEGLAHMYVQRDRSGDLVTVETSVLFTVPEVDTLTALGGRQGATLLTQLRSAFSGEQLGFSYADKAKRLLVKRHAYRLGMTVGVQPDRAAPLLDDSDGGTPQRFIWLPATDPDITDTPPAEPKPWILRGGMWGDGQVMNTFGYRIVSLPEEVIGTIRSAHAARARGEGDALDGHALFAREKVAVALAVLDGRTDMTVEDWALSGHVMNMSDWTRAQIQARLSNQAREADQRRADRDARIADRTEESRFEAGVKRVTHVVEKHLKKRPMASSELRRKVAQRDRGHLDEALLRLADADRIVIDKNEHRTMIKWTGKASSDV